MQYFRTGDPEPGPEVDVLVHHNRAGARKHFLARFQHGWLWAHTKSEIDRHKASTPLRWDFAMAADPGGHETNVRTPNDEERIDWLAS